MNIFYYLSHLFAKTKKKKGGGNPHSCLFRFKFLSINETSKSLFFMSEVFSNVCDTFELKFLMIYLLRYVANFSTRV